MPQPEAKRLVSLMGGRLLDLARATEAYRDGASWDGESNMRVSTIPSAPSLCPPGGIHPCLESPRYSPTLCSAIHPYVPDP